MNKGGPGGSGPTTAAAAAAAQKQKTLLQRVEGDIANIADNFSHLVTVARVYIVLERVWDLSELLIVCVVDMRSKIRGTNQERKE
ncbi:hypothetical protein RYX36_009995 [Vicia faba]